jgi:glycosyltransferase involved in cell wall biosynthesis
MKTLTVFTPTYNRAHTLVRVFESLLCQTNCDFEWLIIDDGSSDETRKLVESWGDMIDCDVQDVDWMGRIMECDDTVSFERIHKSHFVILVPFKKDVRETLRITYLYKENGGLYTGYNAAYANIHTELCVCIDSDDYMPDDAVEKIITNWRKYYPTDSRISKLSPITSKEYCGIQGLDYNVVDGCPIGGQFPQDLNEVYLHELHLRKLHSGDTKQVLRTDLMKKVSPMIGYQGEKNFNPIYMMIQVCDQYPLLIINENLCWVEYQIGADSMSQGIFRQYVNSPRSFAKLRLLEMTLKHNTLKDKCRSAIHYVSSCMLTKDKEWLDKSPEKLLTLMCAPIGALLYCYIRYKNR